MLFSWQVSTPTCHGSPHLLLIIQSDPRQHVTLIIKTNTTWKGLKGQLRSVLAPCRRTQKYWWEFTHDTK